MKTAVLIFAFLLAVPMWGQAAVPCVNKYVHNLHETQHEFDAMVDFTFNVGCHAFATSTLLRKFNANDIPGTANEFMKWVYVGKKRIPGLVKRRKDERALFLEMQ